MFVGGLFDGGVFTIEIALVVFDDLARFPRLPGGFRGVPKPMLDNRQLIGGKMVAKIEPAQLVAAAADDHIRIGQQAEIAGILVSCGDGMPRIGSQRLNNVGRLAINAYIQSFGDSPQTGTLCRKRAIR